MPKSNAERQREWRERQKLQEPDTTHEPGGVAPLQVNQEGLRVPTPEEEQRIRDIFGYSSSETRTKAERDAAAERMMERHRARSGDV